MKKYLLAAVIGAISSSAMATTCQYPLDSTLADYSHVSAIIPFPTISNQSVGYVVNSTQSGANLNNYNYDAASSAGLQAVTQSLTTGQAGGDITLPTSGIVGVEFSVDQFPATADSSTTATLGFGVITSNAHAGQPNDMFQFGVYVDDQPYGIGPWVSQVAFSQSAGVNTYPNKAPMPLTLPLSAGYRMGIYLNMTTRQVGYTVNGVDQGYLTNNLGAPFTMPASVQQVMLVPSAVLQAASGTTLAGAPVSGTLITDSSQFTQPFPAGTMDICGNPTPTQLLLPNGKPFPGKGHAYGLQK